MPIRDVAARNRSLDNDYGPTAGPNAAAQHTLALYAGDPDLDGEELDAATCPGYARTLVPPEAWEPAADGIKTAEPVTFPPPEDDWTLTVTHWALVGDDGAVWDTGTLLQPLDVYGGDGSSDGPTVTIAVFYDDDARATGDL